MSENHSEIDPIRSGRETEVEVLQVSSGTALDDKPINLQGARRGMEDYVAVEQLLLKGTDTACFSVFDGHGGWRVAEFCARELYYVLSEAFDEEEQLSLGDGLARSYIALDAYLEEDTFTLFPFCCNTPCCLYYVNDFIGSTGVSVLITSSNIVFTNLGDSRALLARNGKVFYTTKDHTLELEEERSRVLKAGGSLERGYITCYELDFVAGLGRKHMLAVSRGFGDFGYKKRRSVPKSEQQVSNVPDVDTLIRSEEDEFIVIASDGLWDVMTSVAVFKFVHERIHVGTMTVEDCCKELMRECYVERRTHDNISLVIIQFS